MLIPRLPLCLINAHQPVRSQVVWDEYHYTYASDCRYCGTKILRKGARHWARAEQRAQDILA